MQARLSLSFNEPPAGLRNSLRLGSIVPDYAHPSCLLQPRDQNEQNDSGRAARTGPATYTGALAPAHCASLQGGLRGIGFGPRLAGASFRWRQFHCSSNLDGSSTTALSILLCDITDRYPAGTLPP